MTKIERFRIDLPNERLADLDARLTRAKMPPELPGAGWSAGPTNSFVAKMIDRLRHGFDWRAQEAAINRYPQFITEIDGQRFHFIHAKSARADAIPLLLIHGWPGSIVEFTASIPSLTQGDKGVPAFHLVIPSLPGFGFSGPTRAAGWNNGLIAHAFAQLIKRFGRDR